MDRSSVLSPTSSLPDASASWPTLHPPLLLLALGVMRQPVETVCQRLRSISGLWGRSWGAGRGTIAVGLPLAQFKNVLPCQCLGAFPIEISKVLPYGGALLVGLALVLVQGGDKCGNGRIERSKVSLRHFSSHRG